MYVHTCNMYLVMAGEHNYICTYIRSYWFSYRSVYVRMSVLVKCELKLSSGIAQAVTCCVTLLTVLVGLF